MSDHEFQKKKKREKKHFPLVSPPITSGLFLDNKYIITGGWNNKSPSRIVIHQVILGGHHSA